MILRGLKFKARVYKGLCIGLWLEFRGLRFKGSALRGSGFCWRRVSGIRAYGFQRSR